jgi:transposase
MDGIKAEHLLADKAYDTDALIRQCRENQMEPVIPPKKNRKNKRSWDADLYRLRHLVENAFLHLKRWRGIATRYAKNTASFLAAVHIRCLALWFDIS